jgi:leucyl-tRNA synthetase
MRPFDFTDIEKKWRDVWEKHGIYKTLENCPKPKVQMWNITAMD